MRRNYGSIIVIYLLLLISLILLLWIAFYREDMRLAYLSVNERSAAPTLTPTLTITNSPSLTPTISPTATPTYTPTVTQTRTPEFEELQIIGYSTEGRPMEVIRFGYGINPVMIIAGIHGGYEWNTVTLADQLIEAIRNDYSLIPTDKTLYIMRLFNPDGYEKDKGYDGRANANNVDLNRNWDANWHQNWSGSQCWSYRYITAGTAPFSEIETQVLSSFILEKEVKALISYHSAALGIFSGGWPYDQDSINLANALSLASSYRFPPVDLDCVYTGQLIDWASQQGISAVDIELRNHMDSDYDINFQILQVFLNWEK